jgi:hypothetical protein
MGTNCLRTPIPNESYEIHCIYSRYLSRLHSLFHPQRQHHPLRHRGEDSYVQRLGLQKDRVVVVGRLGTSAETN